MSYLKKIAISTLALISVVVMSACSNSVGSTSKLQSEFKTITITIGQNPSTYGVLGTYADISTIVLDIYDSNNKYYAKSQPFYKTSQSTWSIVLSNIPMGVSLKFNAKAYNTNNVKIYDGFIDQSLTASGSQVYINLFPVSDGTADSIPQLGTITYKADSVVLEIADNSNEVSNYDILYRVIKDPSHVGFTNPQGRVLLDNITGKASIELNYTSFQLGTFVHTIELNNQKGGVLNTTFTTSQTSSSGINIAIAPSILGFSFDRDVNNDTILKVNPSVSDDGNISTLQYKWSFTPDANSASVLLLNDSSKELIINNYNDAISGVLSLVVTDVTNLQASYNSTLIIDQFSSRIAFNVVKTNIINSEIANNASLEIFFSKNVDASTVNSSSLFVSDGIYPVLGNLQVIGDIVVFTPNNNEWNTSKKYVLNVKSDILDTSSQSLNEIVIIDFETIASINTSDGVALKTMSAHSDVVNDLAVSPDGSFLFSASSDNSIKMFDIASFNEINRGFSNHTNRVYSLSISNSGNNLLSTSQDATALLRDIASGATNNTYQHSYGVYASAYAPNDAFVATSSDRSIEIWNIDATSNISIAVSTAIKAIAITPDSKYVVAGNINGDIDVYDIATGSNIRTMAAHTSQINAIAISNDGKYIVSGSNDMSIEIYDFATGSEVGVIDGANGHSDFVNAIAITPNNKYIVSGSSDDDIKLWDMNTQSLLRVYKGQLDIQSIVLSPNGKFIYSGSSDGSISEWNLYE